MARCQLGWRNLGQWTSELEDSNVVINLAGTFWKVLSSAWLYQDNASLVDEL